MPSIVASRALSKKLKLIKTIREVYKHRGIEFFPVDFVFDRPILIPDSEILANFSTILLVKAYHFVICSSFLEEKAVSGHGENATSGHEKRSISEKELRKLNEKIVLFRDECVEELPITDNEADLLQAIRDHLQITHPEGSFEILNVKTLRKIVAGQPFFDVVFSSMKSEFLSRIFGHTRFDALNQQDLENSSQRFREYLRDPDFHHREGRITRGTLMINPLNNLDGEVIEKDRRIKVTGGDLNRAMHGDEVYVDRNTVVGIYKRKTRILVGTLINLRNVSEDGQDFVSEDRQDFVLRWGIVRPLDRRLPDVCVLTSLNESFVLKKVVVHIIEWNSNQTNPRGVIFKILGKNGCLEDEIKAIFEHFQIEYFENANESFPILKTDDDHFTVERAMQEISNGTRTDLRHLDTCSIDPKGCTDIDDALHCAINDEYIEVGVHIADVSFYVLPNSPLDKEARNRSTTVYFPDRRLDMLPAFLSSDLCSLVEKQDRAAFSCVWKFDSEFNIIDTNIFRSVIRSRASLSYEEAHSIITDNTKEHQLKGPLCMLQQIATRLRQKRFQNGALELNTQELYIDSDGNMKIKESVPTHYLVEEFMLLVNITVARFIHKYNPEYSLLRKHPLPSAIELDLVDTTNSKTLNDSLKSLTEDQSTIVKRIITRSMQQALYFSSGESSDFYHYGLATDIYTHFTSPIRRYPDIIVHRTVAFILEKNEAGIDELSQFVNRKACSKMNFRHRNAQNASRMADDLLVFLSMRNRESQNSITVEACIVTVKSNGIVVFIKEYGIEAFVECLGDFKVFEKVCVMINLNFEEYCLDRRINMKLVSD